MFVMSIKELGSMGSYTVCVYTIIPTFEGGHVLSKIVQFFCCLLQTHFYMTWNKIEKI